MDKTLVKPENARSAEQSAHMKEGGCPFCPIDPERNAIIKTGKHWRLIRNLYPYENHKAHFVLVALEHITNLQQLIPEAWAEWGEFNSSIIDQCNLQGGGIVMRFGNLDLSGGTIVHLHSHIQVPDGKGYAIAVFFKDTRLKRFLRRPTEAKAVKS